MRLETPASPPTLSLEGRGSKGPAVEPSFSPRTPGADRGLGCSLVLVLARFGARLLARLLPLVLVLVLALVLPLSLTVAARASLLVAVYSA